MMHSRVAITTSVLMIALITGLSAASHSAATAGQAADLQAADVPSSPAFHVAERPVPRRAEHVSYPLAHGSIEHDRTNGWLQRFDAQLHEIARVGVPPDAIATQSTLIVSSDRSR